MTGRPSLLTRVVQACSLSLSIGCWWCQDQDHGWMGVIIPFNGKVMKAVPSVNANVGGELFNCNWAALLFQWLYLHLGSFD